MLTEIYNLSLKKKSENILIKKSTEFNGIHQTELELGGKNNENIFIDNNGLYFSLFPITLINEIDNNISIEIRISSFQSFKKLFELNTNNQDFIKHISSFYNFILKYTGDNVNSIAQMALQIINTILAHIPGISIVTNIHHSIPALLNCLGNTNIQTREDVMTIFYKIMMIIPTSQLLPYLIQELKDSSWLKVCEIINLLTYLFKELKSIYNDIDFTDSSFDDMIIVEMIKLLNHDTPKVSVVINIRLLRGLRVWSRLLEMKYINRTSF
jgi:hypothetical protein